MYYIEVANYNVEEMHEEYIKYLERIDSKVNLNEEELKVYRENVDKHKKKLQRYWNKW